MTAIKNGSIAQLGEHLPYKQRVIGSSPIVSTKVGPVAQLVRALACHARGRGFEPHPSRHFRARHASVAQLVEQGTENPRVVGSIPTGGTICGFSSFGRAPPCQGGGGGFEPRNPLQRRVRNTSYPFLQKRNMAPWPSGKAKVCKTSIPRFKSGWRLQDE